MKMIELKLLEEEKETASINQSKQIAKKVIFANINGTKKRILLPISKQEVNEIKCTNCDFMVVNKSDLWFHKLKVHKLREFNCALCPYVTKDGDALSQHYTLIHTL